MAASAAPPTDDPFAKAAAAASSTSLPTGAITGTGAPLVTFHRLPARYPYPPRPCSSSSTTTAASIYQTTPPAHHVVSNGSVTGFRNPWPSFVEGGGGKGGGGHKGGSAGVVHARFLSRERKYVPVPSKKEELVQVMKATWIGHASWLLETGVKRKAPIWTPSITLTGMDDAGKVTTKMLDLKSDDEEEEDSDDDSLSSSSTSPGGPDDKKGHSAEKKETGGGKDKSRKKKQKKEPAVERGLRILCDPVFSARMSPVRFAGPKRFTPPPCALSDLPDPVDVVIISHDHYDHLDAPTIRFLVDRERKRQHRLKSGRGILFLCGLGVGRHLQGMGVREEEIVELDWWEGVRVAARGVKGAAARVVATPSQHFSGRGVWDAGKALWCSWVVEEVGLNEATADDDEDLPSEQQKRANDAQDAATGGGPRRLFFAGDTGYRSVPPAVVSGGAAADPDALARLPRCPAFTEIGQLYGPFDLALLPIGCYSPRALLSPVHAAPEDSVCMHKDLQSRRSVAMHYGTVRMPLSEQYEDVREPPRRWREAAERDGLRWGVDVDVCMIGETVLV
ncbi:hypothetical protein SLS55_003807 [Diplodia seriata]|uniref:Metallo-beta-lactamase domain-containing protein n=1 Tax=Diplodia seriata TaxID=420778 RepID=A0ABR3CNZ2_9PEZI